MRNPLCCSLLAASAVAATVSVSPAEPEDPKKIVFFESKIRPLLAEHCYKCHSAAKGEDKGGLTLDTQGGWMDGGDSGPALVPGKVSESLIIEAVEQGDPDFAMPPKYKLAKNEIELLKRWVAMGAPDPRDGSTPKIAESTIDIEAGRKHWSFQPVAKTDPPAAGDGWARGDIDRFVAAKHAGGKVAPVGDADRRTLIRRATYDLVGLPPSPEEIDGFLNDPAPDAEAFAKVVDRLLASRHFGERWGRHWLDVVRYGESMGRTRNYPFPFAWRYRDYVIAAFNKDKPYDQFVREQLAGDLMQSGDAKVADERAVATGFLALGSMDLNERDREKFKMDVVDDQIDVTSRAFMALTAGCARCHDHKFDPLPTADYYALAGIFGSSQALTGYASRQGGNNQKVNGDLLVSLKAEKPKDGQEIKAPQSDNQEKGVRRRIEEHKKEIKSTQQQIGRAKGDAKRQKALRDDLKEWQRELVRLQRQLKNIVKARTSGSNAASNMAMGIRDSQKIEDCKICVRGDVDNRGAEVPRGVPQVLTQQPLAMPAESSGRLELAHWIADDNNPLTARVMANRVWHHLFGRGLVGTVDNFGKTGETPSHPELLDHLASRFSGELNWSVKGLIREVMLSRTYTLSSDHSEAAAKTDPDNGLFWRANVRRLEAEALRDAIMTVSNTIDLQPAKGSPVQQIKRQIGTGTGQEQMVSFSKRSVYLPIMRNNLPEFLEVFDFAEPASVIGKRDVTTVSTQALYLLNDRFVIDQSKLAAQRLFDDKRLENREERIAGAYVLAFGRAPSGSELAAARRYLREASESGQDNKEAWGGFMQALFASAEFRYVM